jgi:hypothetical protein
MVVSFIESEFTCKVDYEAWLKTTATSDAAARQIGPMLPPPPRDVETVRPAYKERAGRPLIFLDVDGVLNCASARSTNAELHLADQLTADEKRLADAATPALLANLEYVVKQTGACVVLSTTWRLVAESRVVIEQRLCERRIDVVGATPVAAADADCTGPDGVFSQAVERAIEIANWLRSAKIGADAAWVAIDDLDLAGGGEGRRVRTEQFVHTDDEHGLTVAKAEEAVAKLVAQQGNVQLN